MDAIAYARLGRDDPRVTVDAATRKLKVQFLGQNTAGKNIEHAIACVGYDANRVAALPPDIAVPHGWAPIHLARSGL